MYIYASSFRGQCIVVSSLGTEMVLPFYSHSPCRKQRATCIYEYQACKTKFTITKILNHFRSVHEVQEQRKRREWHLVPDASNVIYVHCNRLSECLCASEAHSILRCVRTRCGANGDKQVSGCRKHVSLLTTQQDSYLLLVQTPICTRSSLVMITRMTSRCLNTCMERSLLNQRDMKLLTSSAAAKQGRKPSGCLGGRSTRSQWPFKKWAAAKERKYTTRKYSFRHK